MSLLLPYQKEWVNNDAGYSIYEKSRRIGISYAEAAWSVKRRLIHKVDHIFSTSNEKTGKEFLGYCYKFAEALNVACQHSVVDLNDCTSEQMTFPNGSRIVICSSNPTSLRGKGGDLTLDEFAWNEDQEKLYTAAAPVVQWGGQLRIISTHSSPESQFNKIIKSAQEKNFKVFRTTIEDAVAQGLALKVPGDHRLLLPDVAACNKAFLEKIRTSCLTDGMWKQEYCCLFSDQSTIITREMYNAVIIPNFVIQRDGLLPVEAINLYVGVDVARTGDRTVIWIIQEGIDPTQKDPKLQRVYKTIFVKTLKKTDYKTQFEIMKAIISHKGIKKCFIERNGVGNALAESLEEAFPGRVYGWDTTVKSKSSFVERLALWVSQNRIALPVDADLREDILALQRIISPSGRPSYDGRSDHGHCDAYIAAGLALAAAEDDSSFLMTARG